MSFKAIFVGFLKFTTKPENGHILDREWSKYNGVPNGVPNTISFNYPSSIHIGHNPAGNHLYQRRPQDTSSRRPNVNSEEVQTKN